MSIDLHPPSHTNRMLSQCENPSCGRQTYDVKLTEIEGEGKLHLCKKCCRYAKTGGQLRPAKNQRVNECQNENCRSKNIEDGGISALNGRFYCAFCKYYYDTYQSEMPKELVEKCRENAKDEDASEETQQTPVEVGLVEESGPKVTTVEKSSQMPAKAIKKDNPEQTVLTADIFKKRKRDPAFCENPNCGDEVMTPRQHYKGTLYCKKCYAYAYNHNGELRTKEKVAESKRVKPDRCSNPNCGSTNLKAAHRYQGHFYCSPCYCYARNHNGERRTKEIVEQYKLTNAKHERCENVNCMTTDFGGRPKVFKGKYYCRTCATYAFMHDGRQRSKEMVEANRKWREKGRICSNENCKTSELGRARMKDGVIYCGPCYDYFRKHGEQRPAHIVLRRLELREERAEKEKETAKNKPKIDKTVKDNVKMEKSVDKQLPKTKVTNSKAAV